MRVLQKLVIPKDSVNDAEVLIVSIRFKDGAKVIKGDVIVEFETSKAVVTLNAEASGFVFFNCKEGDSVPINATVGKIVSDKKMLHSKLEKSKNELSPKQQTHMAKAEPSISNKAKILLVKNGLDENSFAGQDLVSDQDVLLYLNKMQRKSDESYSTDFKDEKKENIGTPLKSSQKRLIIVCPTIVGMEVILDILDGQNDLKIVGYVADDPYKAKINLPFLDCNVFDFTEKVSFADYDAVVIAISGSLKSMQFRKKVFNYYKNKNIKFANLISKKANISMNVSLGLGNIIGSNVFIGTGSEIGDNNFISYMTTIGHHNKIGSNNLFGPGVMMAGLVNIGDDCILPTGVNFKDKVNLGNRVILPLGYNVLKSIADDYIIKERQNYV